MADEIHVETNPHGSKSETKTVSIRTPMLGPVMLIFIGGVMIFGMVPGILVNKIANTPWGVSMPIPLDILSSVTGFIALYLLVIIMILGTRFPPVERAIGLDLFWSVHRYTALVFLGFLILHIVFKYEGSVEAGFSKPGFGAHMEYMFGWPERVATAYRATHAIATIIGRSMWYYYILQVISTFMAKRSGGKCPMPFFAWFPFHVLSWATPVLLYFHVMYNKHDPDPRYSWQWTLASTVVFLVMAACLMGTRIYRLVRIRKAGRYVISDVRSITNNLTELSLVPHETARSLVPHKRPLRIRPGQFAILYSKKGTPHPLSFDIGEPASETKSPKGKKAIRPAGLTFLIRANIGGKFTNDVINYKPGEELFVDSSYGIFTPPFGTQSADILLVAGGVGISPQAAALHTHARSQTNTIPGRVVLLWCVRTLADFGAMANKMDIITSAYEDLTIVLIVEKADGGDDAAEIQAKYAEELQGVEIILGTMIKQDHFRKYVREGYETKTYAYMCGPKMFMKVSKKALKTIGVGNIFHEDFSMF